MPSSELRQQIYLFIKAFIHENGYAPSVREIGKQFGLTSPSSVAYHLNKLEEEGLIYRDANKERAIGIMEEQYGTPIVGNVAAGYPILAEQHIDGYLPFIFDAQHSDEYFALKVKGDSMIDRRIFDGDIVIVHQQIDCHPNEIVVALFENEATVKTYTIQNNHVWLMPANPLYSPIDGQSAKILGKVVYTVRSEA